MHFPTLHLSPRQVLMQSELLRKEGNETGPHKELEFWKVRSSVIDSIIEQLKLHKVRVSCVNVAAHLHSACAATSFLVSLSLFMHPVNSLVSCTLSTRAYKLCNVVPLISQRYHFLVIHRSLHEISFYHII